MMALLALDDRMRVPRMPARPRVATTIVQATYAAIAGDEHPPTACADARHPSPAGSDGWRGKRGAPEDIAGYAADATPSAAGHTAKNPRQLSGRLRRGGDAFRRAAELSISACARTECASKLVKLRGDALTRGPVRAASVAFKHVLIGSTVECETASSRTRGAEGHPCFIEAPALLACGN